MKRWVSLISVLFCTGIVGSAQIWPTFSGTTSSQQNSTALDSHSVIVSGNVVAADGVALPNSVALVSDCEGHERNEGFTDAKGYFNFTWNAGKQAVGQQAEGPLSTNETLSLCDLRADAPGFISEKIHLSGLMGAAGMLQVGQIVLHAASPQTGNLISATNAAAPDKARKNFQRGCEEAKRGKWDAALSRFREAVHIYPKYAQAWLYLGRVQIQQGNLDDARESLQQALTADDRFVDAYRELADLALKTKRWQELADDTAHVLQLDPQGSQYWYLNSAANYQLKQVDKAEKSALQGLRTDARQTIPQLQYLLAAILTLKHDYRGAAEHIRHYLRLAPHAENAAVAQQQLQQLEKLAGGE